MLMQSFFKENMDIKEIERSLITKYRPKLYRPFIKAIQEFELLKEGDVIGVCISGGKDSLLLAKLFQELLRHSDIKFSCKYLVMNPGYNKENLDKLNENAQTLEIPIIIKNSNIFFFVGLIIYFISMILLAISYKFENIAIASTIIEIINTISIILIFTIFFKESMSMIQIIGLLFGVISLILLKIG